MIELKPGDIFTVEGVYKTRRNPTKKFWQFWKPDRVRTDELRKHLIIGTYHA